MVLNWPTHMDYVGQQKAEKLSHIIVVLFGVIGWIVGYVNQQFFHTVLVFGSGVLLAALLTVPPWPMYRKNPLHWRKPRKEAAEVPRKDRDTATTATKQKKKK